MIKNVEVFIIVHRSEFGRIVGTFHIRRTMEILTTIHSSKYYETLCRTERDWERERESYRILSVDRDIRRRDDWRKRTDGKWCWWWRSGRIVIVAVVITHSIIQKCHHFRHRCRMPQVMVDSKSGIDIIKFGIASTSMETSSWWISYHINRTIVIPDCRRVGADQ